MAGSTRESVELLEFLLKEVNTYFQRLLERLNRLDSLAGMLLGLNGVVITILLTQGCFFSDVGHGRYALFVLLSSAFIFLPSFLVYHATYPCWPSGLLEYEDEDQMTTIRSILEDYCIASFDNERQYFWKRSIVYAGLAVFMAGFVLLVITALEVYIVGSSAINVDE